MSGIFGSSKPTKLPPLPTAPPSAGDIAGEEKKKLKRRYKTVLTSAQGDTSTPETNKKSLLGE